MLNKNLPNAHYNHYLRLKLKEIMYRFDIQREKIFHTDHDSLKYLVNKPDLSGRLARWILLLQKFNIKVKFKKGKSNTLLIDGHWLSQQMVYRQLWSQD